MQHVFYILLLLVFIHELQYLITPHKVYKFRGFKKRHRKHMWTKVVVFFQVLTLFVVLIGLLSSQWLLFLGYFALGLIFSFTYMLLDKIDYKPLGVTVTFIDGLICTPLVMFIVMNKYHLHYSMTEIWEYVIKLF